MNRICRLWSPVILAELIRPHVVYSNFELALNKPYISLEDTKIKVLSVEAKHIGSFIELEIRLQLLCLLEDNMGLELISSEELIRERIQPDEFSSQEWLQQRTELVVTINDYDYHGVLSQDKVELFYNIELMLRVTQDRVVTVSVEEQKNEQEVAHYKSLLQELQAKIIEVEGEKAALRNKMRSQEKNLNGVKQGLSKIERNNMALIKEVEVCNTLIMDLRGKLERQQKKPNENISNRGNASMLEIDQKINRLAAGQVIKRIFQNNN